MSAAEIVAEKMTMSALLRAVGKGLSLRDVPLERLAYGVLAFAASLWVTHEFFSSLKAQLFLAQARNGIMVDRQVWSAPLDDVFIHFDFARSTARGFPFQWSEGNGYSSGGTSLLYPFVLAIGYLLGYQGGQLMLWAGIVACLGVFSMLLSVRHLTSGLPAWTSFVLPPAFVCIGCLSWTLASGMEVAFFLAMWGFCLVTWRNLRHALVVAGPASLPRSAAWLGLANLVLVATRPEAAVIVAIFSISAVASGLRHGAGPTRVAMALAFSAVPGALLVVAQTGANFWFTGESAAAGALVKLEMHHPYMDAQQVREAWLGYVKYQVLRVTDYHFSSFRVDLFGWSLSSGWLIWLLALVPLASRKTRAHSLLLWACVIGWLCIVALNGQVRWQNERYTMPAVAWLLLNSSLGVAVLFSLLHSDARPQWTPRWRLFRATGAALGAFSALFILVHQAPRFRGQLWFFGRASRNIFEQHIAVAERLAASDPKPKRVLLGDAGAIPYLSDIPALDIIGLGGYRKLPFARATRQGLGAALELIQRMPTSDRPDRMAIYPTWWGDLPSWFGEQLYQVSVRGNVICGGRDKVVYAPDWTPLNREAIWAPEVASRVVADLDVADLVSEKTANWKLASSSGYISMKMLPHPANPQIDLWEAGRLLEAGAKASFGLKPLKAPAGASPSPSLGITELLIMVAPSQPATLHVGAPGAPPAEASVHGGDAWRFLTVPVPAKDELQLSIASGELVVYHLWGLAAP